MREEGFISQLVDSGIESLGIFYSIYRGVVVDIDDFLNIDRIKVYVPELNLTDWALPKNNHGSHNCGFRLHPLPKEQDIVYVTFEYGNPAKPLWEWHSWGEDQKPSDFNDPDVCGLVTPKGTKILINDRTGEIYIGAKTQIAISAEGPGIVLSADTIMINANTTKVHHGENGGVINISDLTSKLNNLVNEVESLKSNFNTHTHAGVQSGPGITNVPNNPVTKPISKFNKEDYEDETFLH